MKEGLKENESYFLKILKLLFKFERCIHKEVQRAFSWTKAKSDIQLFVTLVNSFYLLMSQVINV